MCHSHRNNTLHNIWGWVILVNELDLRTLSQFHWNCQHMQSFLVSSWYGTLEKHKLKPSDRCETYIVWLCFYHREKCNNLKKHKILYCYVGGTLSVAGNIMVIGTFCKQRPPSPATWRLPEPPEVNARLPSSPLSVFALTDIPPLLLPLCKDDGHFALINAGYC